MWCNSSSWAIYVQLSIGCFGDEYSFAFRLEDPTLMITKRLNFYLGLWLEKSESVWGFLQCIHLFCWKLALVNQNSRNFKFKASRVLSQLCKSWRSQSKSPSLKTKTSLPTYVEQTFGFPQLPNARGELLFLAARQVKLCPAFTAYWIWTTCRAELMKVESTFVFWDRIQYLSGAPECLYFAIRWSLNRVFIFSQEILAGLGLIKTWISVTESYNRRDLKNHPIPQPRHGQGPKHL